MRSSKQRLRVTLAVLSLLTLPHALLAAPRETGIQGQAFLYISYGIGEEIAPGLWVAPPSVQLPVATSFTVFSAHSGREVAQVITDAAGNYSTSLPPGSYVLASDTLVLAPNCLVSTAPIEITVHAKEVTVANVFYFREGPCRINAAFP